MLPVILCLFFGIIIGCLVRSPKMKYQSQVTLALIWLLLFILGLEIGNNDDIFRQSGALLLKAFVIATAGTLGSVIAAKAFYRSIKKKANNANEDVDDNPELTN